MNENKFLKIFSILGFLAFAAVSCWATAESLHLLLPEWPLILCWIVTVGFFFIASWGTKMIVDSFNQEIYLEKRRLHLLGGIVLTVIFWLLCSMPTNTHTFVYRTKISEKVSEDISMTRGYLGQIMNNTNNKQQADQKIIAFRSDLETLLGELEAEIKNEANPGFGAKSKEILRKFAVLFGVDKIESLTYKSASVQDRIKLCDMYRTKMYILAKPVEENIRKQILSPDPDNIKEIKIINENLALVEKYIGNGTIDLNKPEDIAGINGVCDKINDGYIAVKKNKNFVIFDPKTDEAVYTAPNPETKVKRMISVFDVWSDFLKGEYGKGFFFWVLISVLVDVAAFIFFDIAFKKRN